MVLIQLIARWASEVVARCVAEAPFTSITEQDIRACKQVDVEDVLNSARLTIQELEGRIAGWDRHFAEALEDERRLRDLADAAPPPTALPRGPAFVVAPRGRWHVPACPHFQRQPCFEWRTRCGWRFGLAKHRFEEEAGPQAQLCDRCHPGAPADEPHSDSDAAG